MAHLRFVIPFVLTLGLCAPIPAAEPPGDEGVADLQARLDGLVMEIEEQRERQHIPGLSIAVVADDRVVLARGFGERDIEAQLPATAETIYRIGSTTKAFTAAVIGMLVDEGRMRWDDHVSKLVPEFTLRDPDANEHVTVRDLLCHRTGLMSLDLLWLSGAATWDDMVPCIGRAEPTQPFRSTFQYNNVMYLAAGIAAGRAAGSTWEELVRTRLIEPLGLTHTAPTAASLPAEGNVAKGYGWDAGAEAWQPARSLPVDTVAPAGSIHSNVLDLARWIRFQLGRGAVDDKRLVRREQIEETWRPQIPVGGGVSYGLGWMIDDWNGHRVVEHSGGTTSFTAHVAFLPDEGIGYVVLANTSGTSFPALSRNLVFNALLGPRPGAVRAGGEDAARFLGRYRFDLLRADLTVVEQGGRLAVDVPGQMVYTLNPPDEEGLRTFRGYEQIAVRFDTEGDDEGPVVSMTLFQNGAEFRLPRLGLEAHPEDAPSPDAALLAECPGHYRFEEMDTEVAITVEDGRLAMEMPGLGAQILDVPDEEGWCTVRAVPSVAVRFEREGGRVVAMTLRQRGARTRLARVDVPAEGVDLPTPEEIIALVHEGRGAEAYARILNMRLTGRVRFANVGVEGTFLALAAGFDRYWLRLEFPPFGWAQSSWIGWLGWHASAFSDLEELDGARLEQLKLQHPALLLAGWGNWFEDVRVVAEEEWEGTPVYVVIVQPRALPAQTLRIDRATGCVLHSEGAFVGPGGATIPVEARYEDYRDVAGARFPFKVTTEDRVNGRVEVTIDRIETDVELPEEPWFMNEDPRFR